MRPDNLTKFRRNTNYFLVIVAIFGVSPFFSMIVNYYLFGLLALSFIIAVKRKIQVLNQKVFLVLCFVYALIGIQVVFFRGFSLAAIYFPLITFLLPYIFMKIFRLQFFYYFIRVLYVIAIFTTPIWLLQSIYPPFDALLQNAIHAVFPYSWGSTPRSLLIYTAAWGENLYNSDFGVYRNSGLFHEPGAYAVFLNLALITNTYLTGKKFSRRNIVFILAILTTISTAGYISLFIILSYFIWNQRTNILIKILSLIVFFVVSFNLYQSEEFLKSKIEKQFENQIQSAIEEEGKHRAESGRFFAFYTSFELFKQNPIFGRGIIFATSQKASGEMHEQASYTYGLMGILACYGIIFGVFFTLNFWKGFKILSLITNQKTGYVAFSFIAINLALSSQIFIMSLFCIYILMLGINYSYPKSKRSILEQIGALENRKLVNQE